MELYRRYISQLFEKLVTCRRFAQIRIPTEVGASGVRLMLEDSEHAVCAELPFSFASRGEDGYELWRLEFTRQETGLHFYWFRIDKRGGGSFRPLSCIPALTVVCTVPLLVLVLLGLASLWEAFFFLLLLLLFLWWCSGLRRCSPSSPPPPSPPSSPSPSSSSFSLSTASASCGRGSWSSPARPSSSVGISGSPHNRKRRVSPSKCLLSAEKGALGWRMCYGKSKLKNKPETTF